MPDSASTDQVCENGKAAIRTRLLVSRRCLPPSARMASDAALRAAVVALLAAPRAERGDEDYVTLAPGAAGVSCNAHDPRATHETITTTAGTAAADAAGRRASDEARSPAQDRGAAETAGGRIVAAYVPMAGEPGGPELPQAIADAVAPARLILPVLRDDLDLDWAEYGGAGDLRPAGRGLREPSGARLGPAAIATATHIVVPAVAVDATGVRLGRGGGSYDRALARVPAGAEIIALLYEGEYLPELPAQPHDRRVSAVLVAGAGDPILHRWPPVSATAR